MMRRKRWLLFRNCAPAWRCELLLGRGLRSRLSKQPTSTQTRSCRSCMAMVKAQPRGAEQLQAWATQSCARSCELAAAPRVRINELAAQRRDLTAAPAALGLALPCCCCFAGQSERALLLR